MDRKQKHTHITQPKCLGRKSKEVKSPPEEARNEIMVLVRKTRGGSEGLAVVHRKRQQRLLYLLSQYPFDVYKFTTATKKQIKNIVDDYLENCFDSKMNVAEKAMEVYQREHWKNVRASMNDTLASIQNYNGEGGRNQNVWREDQQYLVHLLSKYPHAFHELELDTKQSIKNVVAQYLNNCFGTQKGGSLW